MEKYPNLDPRKLMPITGWFRMPRRHSLNHPEGEHRGFTLVELVITASLMALLFALLVPAIHKVREAASFTHCQNNLKQIGLSIHHHHDVFRRLPSGGWGWDWVALPDRNTGTEQPGSWLYNILPYLEQQALRKLGAGEQAIQLEQSMRTLLATPVAVLNCPSRRDGGPYPNNNRPYLTGTQGGATLTITPEYVARADYAGNAGSQGVNQLSGGPRSVSAGDSARFLWPDTSICSGVFFQRSNISIVHILRGTSNTFMAGERYINPDHYFDGKDLGDNETLYVGYDNDVNRVTVDVPERDRSGHQNTAAFGSAHALGANMLYCDGSVRLVAYDVDPDVFLLAGRRAD